MLIRVGFSADPDDAFMFWGLASGTVDPRGYEFEPVIDDIQSLNELALEGRLEVTAMSAATYPLVQDRYVLLPHGASIGSGYGPIVVARELLSLDELRTTEIVIPVATSASISSNGRTRCATSPPSAILNTRNAVVSKPGITISVARSSSSESSSRATTIGP